MASVRLERNAQTEFPTHQFAKFRAWLESPRCDQKIDLCGPLELTPSSVP
jgi:hypothetical protein